MSTTDGKAAGPIHDAQHLCWSCREETGYHPFCRHCIKIQPAEDLGDYFSLFHLDRTFVIDPEQLRRPFYELSRKFHPDFYSRRSADEQTLARNNTAYLNQALKVLSDPIRRAEYLLSLMAGSCSSNPTPPQELFEEILAVGEVLLNDFLSADDRRKLMGAAGAFRSRQTALIGSLAPLFNRLRDGDQSTKAEIESRLNNIKYLRTILARIEHALTRAEQLS
jgi:molecular chaperone HscB